MGNLEQSSRKIQKVGESITKFGSNVEKTGKKLTKSITLPIAAIGTAAIKSGIEFESAFAGVKKTLDVGDLEGFHNSQELITEEFGRIRQGIIEMSEEIPMAAGEIAAIAESAGQLGIERKNLLEFSKTMADLSVSTNLTSEVAASSLAKFANVTNMDQGDFSKLGSTIVDLGNHFATTEADIVAMATRLSGAGSQIGLSNGEIMGLATALSSVGIEAEMGGSAFSKAMKKMKVATAVGLTKVEELSKKTGLSLREMQLMADNDTKGFKELAGGLGMTKTELNNVVKAGAELQHFSEIAGMTTTEFKKLFDANPGKALESFIKGLGNTEGAGKSTIEMLQDMGFTEVRLSDSLTRMANSSGEVSKAMEMGNAAWKENTALQKEANQRYETTESKLLILKNKFVSLGIEIKEMLSPAINKAIDLVGKLTTWLKNLDEGTKKNIVKFGLIAAAIGPFLIVLGKVIKTVGKTITLFGKIGSTISKAGSVIGFITSPIGIALIAIGAIAAIAFLVIKNWDKVKAFFSKIGDFFKDTFKKAGIPVRDFQIAFKGLFHAVKGLIKSIGKIFEPFTKTVKKAFSGANKSFSSFQKTVKKVFSSLLRSGIKQFYNYLKSLTAFIKKMSVEIPKFFKKLPSAVKSTFEKMGGDSEKFKATFSKIKDGIGKILSSLKTLFKTACNAIKQAFGGVTSFLNKNSDKIKAIINTIKNVFTVGFEMVKGVISGFVSSAADILGGIFKTLDGIIEFITGVFSGNWSKAWEGIKKIFGGIFDTLVALVKTPINAVIGLINGAISGINKLGLTIPDWVPILGGKEFKINIPKIPMLYKGTNNWGGGPAMVHDKGAEIIDLPRGYRVYPHDKSLKMARQEGAAKGTTINLTITDVKITDKMDIKEFAKEITEEIARSLEKISFNMA